MESPELDRILKAMVEETFDPARWRASGALDDPSFGLLMALGQHLAEMRQLLQITAEINAGLTLDEVLDRVYDGFRRLIPYDRIGVALVDEAGLMVRSRWARSEAGPLRLKTGFTAPLAGSSLAAIIATGQPRILNDLEAYLNDHPDSASTRLIVAEGFRSSLTCPLTAMNRPVGLIFFSSQQAGTYADMHVEIFLRIAGALSVIVEKSRLYQYLIELNELKNKFLGIAAHDLRSPINIIKSYATLILEGYLGAMADKQRAFLVKISDSCDRMLQLINDLLDISAIEAGRLELRPVQLNPGEWLQKLIPALESLAARKTITLQVEIESGLPMVMFDPDRLGQVVDNLVTNAIKFSFPQTTIRIRVSREAQEWVLSVADQGQGIPENELPRLFADFGKTSVKPTGGEKSTGLGLAIVRRIIEAHGGRLTVVSRVGEGSLFSARLPLGSPSSTSS